MNLVTLHCVLRGPGGNGYGIGLAAPVPLAVTILYPIPLTIVPQFGWCFGELDWLL